MVPWEAPFDACPTSKVHDRPLLLRRLIAWQEVKSNLIFALVLSKSAEADVAGGDTSVDTLETISTLLTHSYKPPLQSLASL